jgi:hypothetical protein
MNPEGCLDFLETIVRPFPDLICCRVDIGRYRLNNLGCPDQDILNSLLADEQAAYSYVAPRPAPFLNVKTRVPVHGPYVLSALDAESFVLSTPDEVWDRLQEFINEWHPVNRTLGDLNLDELLVPILESSNSVYRLRDDASKYDPIHAELEFLGCFSEFVAISREDRIVLDIVTSQD